MTHKLRLSKETLRVLDASQSADILGANIASRGGPCLTAEARTQCRCLILTYGNAAGCTLQNL